MKQSGDGGGADAKRTVDQELIRALAALLRETELSEIEIEQDGLRLRVARQLQGGFVMAAPGGLPGMATAPAPAIAPSGPGEGDLAKHPGVVASPMVGTAYVASEPNAPPFVKVGDTVREGQTVLIIEAMKTMNQIPAPRAGKVTRILVQNAQPVEYGEPLMIIE